MIVGVVVLGMVLVGVVVLAADGIGTGAVGMLGTVEAVEVEDTVGGLVVWLIALSLIWALGTGEVVDVVVNGDAEIAGVWPAAVLLVATVEIVPLTGELAGGTREEALVNRDRETVAGLVEEAASCDVRIMLVSTFVTLSVTSTVVRLVTDELSRL